MNQSTEFSDVPGFARYPVNTLPIQVELGSESLFLLWDDGHQSEFHYLWLRDNCPCQQCITPLSREQVFEICDVPLDIKPINTSIESEGRLVLQWDFDNHRSRFHPGWLRSHCYSVKARNERKWQPIIWDKECITQQLPVYDYQQIKQDNKQQLHWLKDQRDYGIALIKSVATVPGTLAEVANCISFIRETNFGTIFDVKSKPNANTAAYTTLRLPLHTDLPTRELQPGLQFLHCLENDAEGGESILVDGFKIAEYLRQYYSDDFTALSSYPMDFYNVDRETDYRFRAPVFALNSEGDVIEVRLANFLRGPIDLPSEQIIPIYKAYRRFIELTRDPQFQFFYRLQPGDLLVFDNRRVLHARNAFDLKQGGRHLQGCYVDRDELLSRIRILERAIM
ncbi:gamma-butyrobetaine dioxygenase [Spartinivicinus poritis]|uniref:Gamma-butyrobetaine dioxygenase n=1 Tax=Spartinivicinus poritis TaxID=2994640 RepID=A0ABT5U2U9_9GAMM|nr:gamma-butyrobetaine dioxygenase [Spartinivicinus sp. A2-2]MDE1460683.1 gamma-butyrobetaine dioxygenase [Spartinivicinus sp. A2-2]